MASEAKHTITPAGVIAYGTPRDDGTERPWFAIHIDEWERQGGNRPSTVLHVGDYVIVTSGPSYEFHGTDKSDAELIVTAVNAYPTLIAERDAALVAVEALKARVAELEQDRARLDFLDRANNRLNAAYGTQYRWQLIMNHNVNRLASGHLVIDLHDMAPNGVPSCRTAIDEKMREVEALSSLPTAQVKHGM